MKHRATNKDTKAIPPADLTEAQAKAELKRLAQEIAAHDERYYQNDAPTISDAEYDALRARNAAIEVRFPAQVRNTFLPGGSAPGRHAALPSCATRCRCYRSTTRSAMKT